MLSAMGRISSGREAGTSATQLTSSVRVIRQASSRPMPRSWGARAASDRRVPPQSGQRSSFKNFSTRFMPFSSLTLDRAFSTVWTAERIGEVQLRRVVGVFGVVEDMLLYRRAVVDDGFFRLCQLPEGHIGAHSHGPAHVGHQRPHQALSTEPQPPHRWSGTRRAPGWSGPRCGPRRCRRRYGRPPGC